MQPMHPIIHAYIRIRIHTRVIIIKSMCCKLLRSYWHTYIHANARIDTTLQEYYLCAPYKYSYVTQYTITYFSSSANSAHSPVLILLRQSTYYYAVSALSTIQ